MENTMVSRIMDAFADDLFRYLLPRRINVMDCRVREKWDRVPRIFHPHFGMSVLCECLRRQKLFFTYYAMMFPSYVQSVESYITFCATYADTLSEQEQNDVFRSMRAVASMILELGVFCHLKGYKNYKYYSTICFSEFFKIFMKQACPTGYNWIQLKALSAPDAKSYIDGKYEVGFDQNRVDFRNEWLRTYDTWAAVYPAIYVIPQTYGSNYEAPSAESEPNDQEATHVPEATSAPEATSVPETTHVPEATSAPEVTSVPETTNVLEVTSVPETTNVLEVTSVPETTNVLEVTSVPETTNVLEVTSVPEATYVLEASNVPPATKVQEAIFAKPADVSELQKKANKEKKVLIVNTTSDVADKYKSSPKKLKLENEYIPRVPVIDEELLDKFRLRVNSEQDSASQQLAEILGSKAKTNILMNDDTFLQVIMQKTARRSRKKMNMGDILELAKLVLGGNDHLARVLVRTVHYIGRAKKAKEAAKKDETDEANKDEAARPWQETGAIPKSKKDVAKSDNRPPRKIYGKLAQEFRITVSSENDAAGEALCELFNSPISSDVLLGDEVFREVMQLTVNYPTNRWGNDWLLSTANSLVAYDLTVGPQPPHLSASRLPDEFLSRLYNLLLKDSPDKGKSKDSGNIDKSKATLPVQFDLL